MSTTERSFSRRDLLKGSGALMVAVGISPAAAMAAPKVGSRATAAPPVVDPNQVDAWIAISADERITILTGKVELGTGVITATSQIVADELDVPMDRIEVVEGDTWQCPDQGTTSGSQSMKTQWASGMRQAAATARAQLLALGATNLGTTPDQVEITNGTIHPRGDTSRKVSFGALIGDQQFKTKVNNKAAVKTGKQLRVVGKSVPRIEIPDKLTGFFSYIQDVKIPGMVHGRVVRPPGINATLVSFDGWQGKEPAGLIKVVVIKNFVGVVCEREEQAITAAENIKLTWKDPGGIPDHEQLWTSMQSQVGQARLLVADGNVDAALAGAARKLEATYLYPYQLHAAMGPSCAIADVGTDAATVWSPTQGPYPLRSALAGLLKFKETNIHVIYKEGAGCYGLNGADTVSLDAALMSQAVGKPVRVQWMRNDEHVWEHYGQPVVVQMKGGLDASGNLVAWDYNGWIASRGGRPGNVGAANLPTGFLIGLTLPSTRPAAPRFPPLGSDSSNTVAGYLQDEDGTVPNARVVARTVDSPFFTGPLRSPARIQNTFANESFIDELAAAAGADPIEYRLRYIGDWRLKRAVEIARDKAGWKAHPAAQNAGTSGVVKGRGFSAMQYEGSDGYAAVVLEISLDTKTGKIKADRIVVSHDVGIVINPDGLRAQIEGNVVQGLGRSLREEVKLGKSSSESIDWESYQILRFLDLPEVEIYLINRPDQPAVGAGENAMTAIPAAMANAIFDATGKRLRRLPFTPARVKAALNA